MDSGNSTRLRSCPPRGINDLRWAFVCGLSDRFQSLERKIVIGKVLIVGWLGSLHPYLPDRSRLARGVVSGGAARLVILVSYFYYMGECQVLFENSRGVNVVTGMERSGDYGKPARSAV